jgi:L-threonylcarbamoyladenylate synthase
MLYNTEILRSSDNNDIIKAARLLAGGEVVGIPTETVYGLAADATNENAVKKIFEAKGRPQDNPLIVHLSEPSELELYVKDIPYTAYRLAEKFWPGPLTMVLPKRDIIPNATSAGLDTVGIRIPAHKTAREIIKACGKPLAAPSANLSGSPSPTSAQHVFKDMIGRIPAVVDGGVCPVGVESTVISFAEDGVNLLRPGFISVSDLEAVAGKVYLAKGITEAVPNTEKVLSPGMKYKHYSPEANITIIDATIEDFAKYFEANSNKNTYAMILKMTRNLLRKIILYMEIIRKNKQGICLMFSENLMI